VKNSFERELSIMTPGAFRDYKEFTVICVPGGWVIGGAFVARPECAKNTAQNAALKSAFDGMVSQQHD
jgi:hypothetical protein